MIDSSKDKYFNLLNLQNFLLLYRNIEILNVLLII